MSPVSWSRSRVVLVTVLAVLTAEGVVVLAIYGGERVLLGTNRAQMTVPPHVGPNWYLHEAKGIERPPTVAAEKTSLRPDDAVIGVVVGGKARAYRLGAFLSRDRHIVNDLIAGVPVSVTYCDLTDCLHVYTDPRGSTPLDVAQAGLLDGEMVVRLNGALYIHKTGRAVQPAEGPAEVPFDTLTPTRTTWKEWVDLHPETDVYEGALNTGVDINSAPPARLPR